METNIEKLNISTSSNYFSAPFLYHGKLLTDGPRWHLTNLSNGSMRFRWNETNELRNAFFKNTFPSLKVTPVELIHSQDVVIARTQEDTKNLQADGILTQNMNLLPVITVADCMPIYLYDPVANFLGVLHSGWKGTGIITKAVEKAKENFGAKPENICVVMGPHIHDCCYIIDQERASYFTENFGPDCVKPATKAASNIEWNNGNGPLFSLSLEKANLYAIKKAGIPQDNIISCTDCTACSSNLGSHRRQMSKENTFTVMAAFVTEK